MSSTPSRLRAYGRRQLYEGALNIAWLLMTLSLLAATHYLWPHRTWLWGLVLGAGVGGSAVFGVAHLEVWRRSR